MPSSKWLTNHPVDKYLLPISSLVMSLAIWSLCGIQSLNWPSVRIIRCVMHEAHICLIRFWRQFVSKAMLCHKAHGSISWRVRGGGCPPRVWENWVSGQIKSNFRAKRPSRLLKIHLGNLKKSDLRPWSSLLTPQFSIQASSLHFQGKFWLRPPEHCLLSVF